MTAFYIPLASIPDPGLIPFSIARFIVLVAWVFLCFFLVQKMQYSPLIRSRYRTITMLMTLLTGPLCMSTLILVAAIRRYKEGDNNFIQLLQQYGAELTGGLSRIGALGTDKGAVIELMDACGRTIDELYGHNATSKVDHKILTLTENIIAKALDQGASDILIAPKGNGTYIVRFRVDGLLRTQQQVDAKTSQAVVNSIKAVANMDISEKRRPQDGAFAAKRGDVNASFRVASTGVLNGEKLSIRLLNQNASQHTLDQVGLPQKQLKVIRETVAKPSGMILVCGPTGSGKTTTLYALLNEMDRYTRNVITIEDPIEAALPEASQIEINTKADITFEKTLRSVLRQDPDVICVGEIRDEETAEIALRAAQTGHLVLATLHCDSNAAAIMRLIDLGISPMLIASGLRLLISQRLVRCLCQRCRKPADLSPDECRFYQDKRIDPKTVYAASGCPVCHHTGYLGRTAIADLTVLSAQLRTGIVENKRLPEQLNQSGAKTGKSSLYKQGLKKVVSGITTFAEIKRVIG